MTTQAQLDQMHTVLELAGHYLDPRGSTRQYERTVSAILAVLNADQASASSPLRWPEGQLKCAICLGNQVQDVDLTEIPNAVTMTTIKVAGKRHTNALCIEHFVTYDNGL